MELTEEHILFIRQDIIKRGVVLPDLVESLIDHICCAIENDYGADFDNAYSKAIDGFGEGGLMKIQQETILLLTLKKQIFMKKTMYVSGYIAAFLITTGLLFKMQQWPGAVIMLTLGVALFNFGFLPLFFLIRYKRVGGLRQD